MIVLENFSTLTGPILESKGMRVIFHKKGQKKGKKRAKYLKIWAKMYQIWKHFEKGQSHACKYRMHETPGICSVLWKF